MLWSLFLLQLDHFQLLKMTKQFFLFFQIAVAKRPCFDLGPHIPHNNEVCQERLFSGMFNGRMSTVHHYRDCLLDAPRSKIFNYCAHFGLQLPVPANIEDFSFLQNHSCLRHAYYSEYENGILNVNYNCIIQNIKNLIIF